MHDIVKNEYLTQRHEKPTEQLRIAKKAIRHFRAIDKDLVEKISKDLEALYKQNIEKENRLLEEWCAKLNAQVLSLQTACAATVFESYFKGEGCFHEALKVKNHIPDAFILSSTTKFASEHQEESVILLASDKRLKEAATKESGIQVLESLGQFFDLDEVKALTIDERPNLDEISRLFLAPEVTACLDVVIMDHVQRNEIYVYLDDQTVEFEVESDYEMWGIEIDFYLNELKNLEKFDFQHSMLLSNNKLGLRGDFILERSISYCCDTGELHHNRGVRQVDYYSCNGPVTELLEEVRLRVGFSAVIDFDQDVELRPNTEMICDALTQAPKRFSVSSFEATNGKIEAFSDLLN